MPETQWNFRVSFGPVGLWAWGAKIQQMQIRIFMTPGPWHSWAAAELVENYVDVLDPIQFWTGGLQKHKLTF